MLSKVSRPRGNPQDWLHSGSENPSAFWRLFTEQVLVDVPKHVRRFLGMTFKAVVPLNHRKAKSRFVASLPLQVAVGVSKDRTERPTVTYSSKLQAMYPPMLTPSSRMASTIARR